MTSRAEEGNPLRLPLAEMALLRTYVEQLLRVEQLSLMDAEDNGAYASRLRKLHSILSYTIHGHDQHVTDIFVNGALLREAGRLLQEAKRQCPEAARPQPGKESASKRLLAPPGFRLRGVLAFVYSRKTMARVFEPTLADMQTEWQDAMVANRIWKARWVRVRGYASLANAAGAHSLVGLVKQVVSFWKASG